MRGQGEREPMKSGRWRTIRGWICGPVSWWDFVKLELVFVALFFVSRWLGS